MKDEANKALPTELDPILMNPTRFIIATTLYLFGQKKEGDLKKILGIPWGNLSTHLRRLEEAGYIKRRHVLTVRGPRVMVSLTERGLDAYSKLSTTLRKLLEGVKKTVKA
ncbi:transcriptional regulator [archaeon]|nr:MAG: transcriptional regulator [archaeon]